MPRREKWGIVGAILSAVETESLKGNGARLTNVASRANIAYDRLQDYLDELVVAGLLAPGRVPVLTPKGREFLRYYRQWVDLLGRFGLTSSEAAAAPPAKLALAPEPERTPNGYAGLGVE